MRKCYVYENVNLPSQEYEVHLYFNKPTPPPGENHTRSIQQYVCGKKCLANMLKIVAEQTEG